MTESSALRVLIADDEAVIRMGLSQMVANLGHRVIATAANGVDTLAKTNELKPQLLLLDIKMPEMDGLTVAEILQAEMPLPIVMLTAYSERGLIERAANASVMGYLVKPIHENKLGPAIEVAIARFEVMQAKAQEVYRLRGQLEARNLVDAAKQILVTTGLSEAEAYKRLQMTARRKRLTMRQVAEAVIAVGQNV
ncbi:MAG: putative transcriptional regulatory protein pdtaR [Anaerolineae bacterium]|nr:putative transcriptional regulatory protein pdtaR [Anaerolineae bacterium]